ncbi:tagatose-bisphosphate aldolase [Cricetibacter osteomyelitidis]|uniref:tagatose-bisphosphate aldolase n=1 Tax=Cricetibacter osteomyelitidis TaxID=1521931 RepID=A0A4R2TQI6_9PAST|nr:tagatose 1,6-diphosphate aldolase [Cricetibacter osteomyelitidis]TCP97282.1 tagatose-bisphosphate aldolase [Cricetibacter osteomyelitidis]
MSNIKQQKLQKLCDKNGIIGALAIDQRGALRRMLGDDIPASQAELFKSLVSKNLTPYASSILLDPEYGWVAANQKVPNCGLIMAYEKTGYDKNIPGRYPDLIDNVSVLRLKEKGADAVKLLLYVDVDEGDTVNDVKKTFVERVGAECKAEGLPFFLEILTYDAEISNKKAFASLKPHKVIEAMKQYSDPRFAVDVLKVEVPVDMNFVQSYGDDVVHTAAQAQTYFKQQSDATNLPFIFLSAGVKPKLFQDTLIFAKQAGSRFNGVLCGRATWAGAAEQFKAQGEQAANQWLQSEGVKNISELNDILKVTATPIKF